MPHSPPAAPTSPRSLIPPPSRRQPPPPTLSFEAPQVQTSQLEAPAGAQRPWSFHPAECVYASSCHLNFCSRKTRGRSYSQAVLGLKDVKPGQVPLASGFVFFKLGFSNRSCCFFSIEVKLIYHIVFFSAAHQNDSFHSVQVLSRVRLFVTPRTAARQASVSITSSRSLLRLMPMELVIPSNHLILCRPLLFLPSIFPSIRVFSNESALHIRWPNYWSFSFSISPSKEHPGLISLRMDWLDLLAVQG